MNWWEWLSYNHFYHHLLHNFVITFLKIELTFLSAFVFLDSLFWHSAIFGGNTCLLLTLIYLRQNSEGRG